VLSYTLKVYSQDNVHAKNTITFSLGQGFEDAIVHYSYIPTMGLGYERAVNNKLSVYGNISTFYRRFINVQRPTPPSVGRIIKNSTSPFLTAEDFARTENLGIKDLDAAYTYKALSVPLSFGFKYTPLRYKRHSLNLYGAAVGMYENKNFHVEALSGPTETINDMGITEEQIVTLYSETNWRNFTFGEHIGLGYEVDFGDFGVEISASEKNIIFAPNNTSIVYDLSICLKLKI